MDPGTAGRAVLPNMPWVVRLTVASFLVSAAIAAGVIVLSWSRRSTPGGRALIAMMASVCLWSLPAALALITPSLTANLYLSKFSYLGIVGVPLHYLVVSICVTRPDLRVGVSGWLALGTPAVAVLTLVFTNDWHHLVWTALHWDPTLGIVVYEHGPAYYGLFGCLASMALGATVLNIASAWQQPGPRRAATLAPAAAAILPLVTTSAYALRVSPISGVDVTPGAFAVAGILMAVGLTRYRMLDLLPVARAVLFDRLPDGIVVLDDRGRVVDANPAAVAFLGPDRLPSGGTPADPVPAWSARTGGSVTAVGDRFLDVRSARLVESRNAPGGTLLLLRDVTRQHAAEAALRAAESDLRDRVADLEHALRDVRTLQGLLPICAYCKRVRTDENYWQQIESYVSTRSDLRFSHGICPDCYPKVADEFAQDAPGPADRRS